MFSRNKACGRGCTQTLTFKGDILGREKAENWDRRVCEAAQMKKKQCM